MLRFKVALISSIYMSGMIAGSFIGGRTMDWIGRKWGKASTRTYLPQLSRTTAVKFEVKQSVKVAVPWVSDIRSMIVLDKLSLKKTNMAYRMASSISNR